MKKFNYSDEFDLEEIKRKLFNQEPVKTIPARDFFMQHEPRYCEFTIKMRILFKYMGCKKTPRIEEQIQEEFNMTIAAERTKEAKEDEIYGEIADLLGLPRCIRPLVLAYTGFHCGMLDYDDVAKKLFRCPVEVAKRYIYEVRQRFIAAFGSDI